MGPKQNFNQIFPEKEKTKQNKKPKKEKAVPGLGHFFLPTCPGICSFVAPLLFKLCDQDQRQTLLNILWCERLLCMDFWPLLSMQDELEISK